MFINNNDNSNTNNKQNSSFYGNYDNNNQKQKTSFLNKFKDKKQENNNQNFYNNQASSNVFLGSNNNETNQNNDDNFYYSSNQDKQEKENFFTRNKRNIGLFICLGILLIGIIAIIITFFINSNNSNKVSTNLTSFGIVLGKEYQIKTFSPNYKAPNFNVDKNDVITLNKTTGYIKTLKEGEVTIKLLNSEKKEQQQITVYVVNKKVNVSDFKVDEEMSLEKGEKKLIYMILTPLNATELNFTYNSSNPNVVSVTNGLLEGLNEGTATITVKCNNIVKNINVTVE